MSGTGPGGESLTPATTSDQRSNDVATLRRVRTLRILEPLGARFGVCLAFRRNAMLKERRQHQRHSINRVAKIQSAGSLPRDCLIADISEGGGRLYAEGIVVPDQFVLLLTGSRTVRRECRVVWRLGNEIGIEFA